ncbi:MAG TPA: FAD-dependent monooxygenase [Nannocystaceae bacterium]|nr:FAD-dependent monooxygenase [Nannocystaceae bacterium]
MQNPDILVSGASIAGPVLAAWLRRHGFAPTIVERSAGIRPGGQAVDIRGAARDVVERMGIMQEVRAATCEGRGLIYVDADDRVQTRMPAELFGGDGIVAELEILRGDLASVLYDAIRDDVEVLFDDSIARLDDRGTAVDVELERGGRRTFDLVVGADGIHSRVRKLGFGPEERFVRPLGGYTAYFTIDARCDTDGWFAMHNVPGGRVAAIRPDRQHRTKAMFSFSSPPLDYDRRDVEAQKRIVAERFADVGWKVPRLLAGMWESSDFYLDLFGQVKLDSWSRGRLTLVGDAGYCPSPLTGLGTSLAIVGAYVLAGELAAAGGDHRIAFARYEAALRPWIEQCQELPAGSVRGYLPQTRMGIALRNLSMTMMTKWPWRSLAARMLFGKAGSFALSDYAAA